MDAQELQSLKNKYDIIGTDPALNRALEIASSVAPTDLTVLVVGESGVGKENIPKIIHQHSRRRTGKYFAVNCGAIPEGTIDSELFGHEKGAFTGANEMRRGYFEEADGGTLFLDEIGELPMASQAKLLRVLQDGEFIRVGSSKVMRCDVRVVAATNVDLQYAVQRGKFRADLYYRLNAVTIKMPSLRERPQDIQLLFRKFTSDFSQKYGVCKINLSPEAAELLRSYRWPGNIRQLKNVAETVSALESSRITPTSGRCEISAEALSKYIPRDGDTLPSVTVHDEGMSSSEKEMLVRMIYKLNQEVEYLKKVVASGGVPDAAARQITPLEHTIAPTRAQIVPQWQDRPENDTVQWQDRPESEDPEWQDSETAGTRTDFSAQRPDLSLQNASNELIRKALERHRGNRKEAAAELGISERTLYRKLKELDEAQTD